MRPSKSKIRTLEELLAIRAHLRRSRRLLVFTNGCFDLIHPGHIRYLEKARHLGQQLLVAVNSDASVRRLKGAQRPVQTASQRAQIVAALEAVDWVVIFEELTPDRIIEALLPDILVKGGDWPPDQIAGREAVESAGGSVVSIKFEKGYSTTGIIKRIRRRQTPSGQAGPGPTA